MSRPGVVIGVVGGDSQEKLATEQTLAGEFLTVLDYDLNGNVIYAGKAAPGSAKSAAVWQIKNFLYSGSNVTDILWADGNASFDNIWDSRASLSYS